MKWDVTLLLSVPTSINRISCFRCTFVLIPIGGRSWLYKLLYKCMKCGYEKEQIWSEKSNWSMKLYRHINSDIQKRSKHYFQIKSPLDKGCHMRVVRKNTKNRYLWTRCGPNCCTLEHVCEKMLQFVSIRERMWEMHFISSGDSSRLQFSISKVVTLTNL